MAEGTAGSRPANSERTLSNWALASYGAPAMPLSMVALPMAVYLPAVYADSEGFGLGLAFVGLVMVLSRIFDGITARSTSPESACCSSRPSSSRTSSCSG